MPNTSHACMESQAAPVAGFDNDQVVIRPLGVVPTFLEEAMRAGQAGNSAALERILTSSRLVELTAEHPPRHDLILMMVRLWAQVGRTNEALSWCEKIPVSQRDAFWHWQMAELLISDWAQVGAALQYAQRAVDLEPENRVYQHRLACHLCRGGFLETGLDWLEALLRKQPDDTMVLKSLLSFKSYSGRATRANLQEGFSHLAHLEGGARGPMSYKNDRTPDRCLRIGFVSPDFRRNSAAQAIECVLDGRDPQVLEAFAYANVARPDAVTARLRGKFNGYRDIWGMDSATAAALVRQDRIDILVAVGGYVIDNRLDVLRYRPAPIQVELGSFTTTGLPEVDYRFADPIIDPPESLSYYTETSLYPSGGLPSFVPPPSSPMVGPLPALVNGFITYGVCNNHLKISDAMLMLWARILREKPDAHLIMKCACGDDPALRARFRDKLVDLGVPKSRIEVLPPTADNLGHLDLYNRIDLSLDTFPFGGSVTTFEGLWMGVPPITLVGDTFVSRVGLSTLSKLGLEIFAAASEQEYVAKALALADQWESLATLRQGLRDRLLRSPLCQPRSIAAGLEEAFRQMWRAWLRIDN